MIQGECTPFSPDREIKCPTFILNLSNWKDICPSSTSTIFYITSLQVASSTISLQCSSGLADTCVVCSCVVWYECRYWITKSESALWSFWCILCGVRTFQFDLGFEPSLSCLPDERLDHSVHHWNRWVSSKLQFNFKFKSLINQSGYETNWS